MPVLCRAGILGRSAAIAILVALAAPGLPPAHGQSRLGGPDAAQLPGGPPGASIEMRDRQRLERDEAAAGRLLASARLDLSAGRIDVGQRALEMLVARFPDSATAGDARRELLRLYSIDRTVGAGSTVPSAQPVSPVAAATPAPVPRVAAQGWRTSIISFRRFQDELRHEVGDRVFFSVGSADLGSRARAVISAQANWLQRRPDVAVVVEGHADDAHAGGDDELLSQRRAGVVRDLLVAKGVEAERIRLMPQGSREPVAVCGDSDCAAQNRRAVVQVGVRRAPSIQNRVSEPQGGENQGHAGGIGGRSGLGQR